MRRKNQIFALFLALVLALGTISGCAKSTSPQEPAQTEVPTPEVTNTTDVTETPEAEEPTAPSEREITDMAGRKVIVPAEISTVFSCNPISAIYLYTLVPDQLLGWNYELNDIEKSVILEKYHSLPNFGMGDSINYETVIAANPTIALNVSSINDGTVDDAQQLEEKLGVPVIVVSNSLEDAAEVYRFMGELFGVEEQAEKLANYAETTFSDIANMDISDDQKIRMYYGNGDDSLETAPAGSGHGQIIEMVNAINVADLEAGDGSRVRISKEQLLAWDPDVIIVNGEPKSNTSGSSAAENLTNDADFASLKAVTDGMVLGAPNAPFSWVDRPPGPNRIIGMRWLAKTIYPDHFEYDLDEEVRHFFELFYHTELSDEKLASIYDGSSGASPN